MDASVLICTYNRAALLADTLDSLARVRVPDGLRWEVIVVDNNSTDATREVVETRAPRYPAPLRRIFEKQQGKSLALNTAIPAAAGGIIVLTDDDVRIPAGWLAAAVRPLMERSDIEYTGGPVRPLWQAPAPKWLRDEPGLMWGPLALVDYGGEPFIFEDRRRIALGVNMAVRASLIDAIGGFHPALDRRGTSLLGQGQAEFFFRSRAAGARGLYVPDMVIEHVVPAARLTRSYFRRWWYWKGIARARLEELYPISELGIDLASTHRFLGVPRFMWGSAVRDAVGWLGATVENNAHTQAEREMGLAYFTGYASERRARQRRGTQAEPFVGTPRPGSPAAVPEGTRRAPRLSKPLDVVASGSPEI
jgi:glycosyltransferase involved in cell wall biosynthesis